MDLEAPAKPSGAFSNLRLESWRWSILEGQCTTCFYTALTNLLAMASTLVAMTSTQLSQLVKLAPTSASVGRYSPLALSLPPMPGRSACGGRAAYGVVLLLVGLPSATLQESGDATALLQYDRCGGWEGGRRHLLMVSIEMYTVYCIWICAHLAFGTRPVKPLLGHRHP